MPRDAASFGDAGSVDDTWKRPWARTAHACACTTVFPRFTRAQVAMQRLELGRLAERLERLISEAEELSGRRGITTHEAKEVFRFNGARRRTGCTFCWCRSQRSVRWSLPQRTVPRRT